MLRSNLLLLAALLLLPEAASAQGTPFAINGQLKVCGTKLCNKYGNPIQLRGMSTHGLQWFPWGDCLKDASLQSLVTDWGADILRVAVYIQEQGWETNKAKFNTMVDQVVDAATAKGLYVIIDFHLLTPGDPNANLNNAKEFFERMVPRHGSKGNILWEIANEPNGVPWSTIKQYADQVIPIVRKHDAKSPILVGTMAWSSLGVSGQGPWTNITAAPITDPNTLYVVHFYAGEHKDAYRNAVRAASDKLPLFVTEFGTQAATGDGANDLQSAQAWLDLLKEKKISWVNWNFSDDFRAGAVLKTGTCPNGPWTGGSLKEAGTWIQERMKTPDDFPTTPTRLGRGAAMGGDPAARLQVASEAGRLRVAVDLEGEWTVEVRDLAGRITAVHAGRDRGSFALARMRSPGVRTLSLRGVAAGVAAERAVVF